MNPTVPAGIRWPNVPACYGWLSLDRRGRWRLQGEPVSHGGLIDFLNRGYGSDAQGRHYVQNGPQRVFVRLDYTPWIVRLEGRGFCTHLGTPVEQPSQLFLDDAGNVLVGWADRIGLLDDRHLASFLNECQVADTRPAGEDDLLALMAGQAGDIRWQNTPIAPIRQSDVASRFGFDPDPHETP